MLTATDKSAHTLWRRAFGRGLLVFIRPRSVLPPAAAEVKIGFCNFFAAFEQLEAKAVYASTPLEFST